MANEERLDHEGERRYAVAFYYAVVIERLRFTDAEPFAGWFARAGFLFPGTIEDAFENWRAESFPRVAPDDEKE